MVFKLVFKLFSLVEHMSIVMRFAFADISVPLVPPGFDVGAQHDPEKKLSYCYPPRRLRPGTGDIATPPVCPSVRPSVRPSVTFSFRTVTQKGIDVFSRNFAGTCTCRDENINMSVLCKVI